MDAGHSGPGVGGHVAPMSDPLAAAHAGRQPLLRIKLCWEVHGVSPAAQRQLTSLKDAVLKNKNSPG
jgi:hypothetical protein